MLEAIGHIADYTTGMDEAGFRANRLVRDAVMLNIQIVGEAANRIMRYAPRFTAAHADIPWKDAYDVRNHLSHGYDRVNLAIVWAVVANELPALAAKLRPLTMKSEDRTP
jgi:uncharacterized protein with HEPN domain